MRDNRTIQDKIAEWWEAYQPIRDTLTPEAFRQMAVIADPNNVQAINLGLAVARIVFENDRTAAVVAQSMTQYPSSPGGEGDY